MVPSRRTKTKYSIVFWVFEGRGSRKTKPSGERKHVTEHQKNTNPYVETVYVGTAVAPPFRVSQYVVLVSTWLKVVVSKG